MIWLILLFYSSIPNIFVATIYVSSLNVMGRINIESISKEELLGPRNVTSQYSFMNITNLATKYGYVIEEHKVTTEDGYILGLHRLMANATSQRGVPVFLMHGLLDSSDSWILQGGNNALGFLLVDRGYDVWMGNSRGNKHSSAHTSLNPNDETFWKFSWEEIGVYDLPAMIDYVLRQSDKKSVYYIGHSQGTTSFLVMNSLKPQYRQKIKMMFALSPIAWLSHASSPMLKYLSTVPAAVLLHLQFLNTLTSSSDFLYQLYGTMCKVISTGCTDIFEMLFGTNYFVSEAMLPVILDHASSSSVMQLVHYWQLYRSGRFCRFDYGWMRNLLQYGSFTPPDYELSDVTVPIVLFFSGNDRLSHPTDVATLHSHLRNVYKTYYSEIFSHIDYMYANVAKEAVYEKIMTDIQNFDKIT